MGPEIFGWRNILAPQNSFRPKFAVGRIKHILGWVTPFMRTNTEPAGNNFQANGEYSTITIFPIQLKTVQRRKTNFFYFL